MNVAVVGSRDISMSVAESVVRYVRELPEQDTIITGDASGVDAAALRGASGSRVVIVVKPAWHRDGKKAGPLRNKLIAHLCDRMVAFWDGKSRGTLSAIRAAKSMGKDVIVIDTATWSCRGKEAG